MLAQASVGIGRSMGDKLFRFDIKGMQEQVRQEILDPPIDFCGICSKQTDYM